MIQNWRVLKLSFNRQKQNNKKTKQMKISVNNARPRRENRRNKAQKIRLEKMAEHNSKQGKK